MITSSHKIGSMYLLEISREDAYYLSEVISKISEGVLKQDPM